MTPHEAYQIWRMGRFNENPDVTEAFNAGFVYGMQEGMSGGRGTRSQATIAALSGLLASSIEMHDPSQYAQAAINIGEEVAKKLDDQDA